jgi:chemotaxis family two-component system response regulator Rcp1
MMDMSDARSARPVEILIIEDNAGDVRLAREGLAEWKLLNNLHVAEDGVIALRFLRRQDEYADVPRPDLIMLDLNLPRKDGREVLKEIKEDESLKSIPVVILTTSKAEEDILTSYSLHANCYVTKPLAIEQFITVVHAIESFWFSIVKLPAREQ